jgi:hypothetical protein
VTLTHRGKVAAKQKFLARQVSRMFTATFYRNFSATRGKMFFSWTAILSRTYRNLFRTIYRDLYQEI